MYLSFVEVHMKAENIHNIFWMKVLGQFGRGWYEEVDMQKYQHTPAVI